MTLFLFQNVKNSKGPDSYLIKGVVVANKSSRWHFLNFKKVKKGDIEKSVLGSSISYYFLIISNFLKEI